MTKPPVLVVLPPTHKCPDLERVLKLARKAFDDVALNILDLNLRFAWVSADELQQNEWATSPSPSALAPLPPTAVVPAVSLSIPATASSSFHSQNVNAPACTEPVPPANISHPRVLISDLVPTLCDAEILRACTNGAVITGATLYSPLPIGPSKSKVRAVIFSFSKVSQANVHLNWVKQAASTGSLVGKVVTSAVSVHILSPGVAPSEFMQAKTTAASHASDSKLPFSPDPISLASVPPATAVPSNLPDAQGSPWRLMVGNLRESLANKPMLASIVPRGVQLLGATLHPLKRLDPCRPELARVITLGFKTKAEADICRLWIKHHSKAGGFAAEMVVPGVNVYMTEPHSSTGSVARPSSPPPPTPPATDPSTRTSSPTVFRVIIGNLLEHVTKDQIVSAVAPAGVAPAAVTLQSLQQLSCRPEKARFVRLDFDSQHAMQTMHNWIEAEAVAGGRLAKLLIPNVKVSLACHPDPAVTSPPTLPSSNVKKSSAKQALTTKPAVPAKPTVPPKPTVPAPLDLLPEASPNHYRLHVSNLQPDLELAQIIPALVPRDVKLAGASLFAPRPMGGSRRELVCSLKFAFLTASDAKRCQQWIKKDSGGSVAKVVLPGAKIVVGNPMDPMIADGSPVEPYETDRPANDEPLLPRNVVAQPPPLPFHSHSPAPNTLPTPSNSTASLPASRSPSVSSTGSQPLSPTSSSFHITVTGIDPGQPVATVFGTILGSLSGSIEPRGWGAEFVFDSEATAKQFVLHVWMGMREGKYAWVTAEGEELKIVKGSSSLKRKRWHNICQELWMGQMDRIGELL